MAVGAGGGVGEKGADRLEMAGLRNDKENGILTILLLFINGNVFRMRKKKKNRRLVKGNRNPRLMARL